MVKAFSHWCQDICIYLHEHLYININSNQSFKSRYFIFYNLSSIQLKVLKYKKKLEKTEKRDLPRQLSFIILLNNIFMVYTETSAGKQQN